MSQGTPEAARTLSLFLERYMADLEEGRVLAVGDYQLLFPGIDAVIARELALLERGRMDAEDGVGA